MPRGSGLHSTAPDAQAVVTASSDHGDSRCGTPSAAARVAAGSRGQVRPGSQPSIEIAKSDHPDAGSTRMARDSRELARLDRRLYVIAGYTGILRGSRHIQPEN